MTELFLALAWRVDEWAGWITDPASGTARYLASLAIFTAVTASPAARAWVLRAPAVGRIVAAAALLALPAAATCLAFAWAYVATPAFLDHVEPQIAAVSWHLATGAPLWHAPGATPFYALPYGPLAYEVSYAALALFGPSLAAAKLAGPAAATAALALLWPVLRRAGLDRVTTLAVFFTLTLMLFRFSQSAYWNRPDPFIVLLVMSALWSRGWRSATARWISLGVVAGALFTLKIHAPAYVLPIVAAEVFATRRPILAASVMALGAAAAIALAFLPAGADPGLFLFWVGVAVRHGGNLELFVLNVAYVAVWLVPLGWLARGHWAGLERGTRAAILTLAIVSVAVLYPASKHGAGPWHFVPLVPVAAWLGLGILRTAGAGPAAADRSRGLAAYAVTVAVLTLPATVVAQTLVLRNVVDDSEVRAARAELRAALDRYREETVAVGYAGSARYRISFLRPAAVYAGHAYLYDASAFMDLTYATAGLLPPPPSALAQCPIEVWLIPAGEPPFSLRSVYDMKPAFPAEFVAAFRAAYRRTAQGTHFDVWTCAKR
ncbi:MAG: hypothetical protein AB7K86_23455 [Rhodospirillales bacterium]